MLMVNIQLHSYKLAPIWISVISSVKLSLLLIHWLLDEKASSLIGFPSSLSDKQKNYV